MDLIGRLRIAPQFILLAILIPGVIHWYLRESSHASLKIGDVMGGIVNRCTPGDERHYCSQKWEGSYCQI